MRGSGRPLAHPYLPRPAVAPTVLECHRTKQGTEVHHDILPTRVNWSVCYTYARSILEPSKRGDASCPEGFRRHTILDAAPIDPFNLTTSNANNYAPSSKPPVSVRKSGRRPTYLALAIHPSAFFRLVRTVGAPTAPKLRPPAASFTKDTKITLSILRLTSRSSDSCARSIMFSTLN